MICVHRFARKTLLPDARLADGARLILMIGLIGGCASHKPTPPSPPRPDVAPGQPRVGSEPLQLDSSQIKPMYTEMMAVDLAAVIKVAAAQNFDIRQARQEVEALRGQYESVVGGAFPAIVPTALFEHVDGTVRATEGNLVGVVFNTFQPSIALQWIVNPGRVIYAIIAAKKRLSASKHDEKTVILDTLRHAAVQYYDLVLRQAHVSAAHQSVLEADELLRITKLRLQTGMGVPADKLRAVARLAGRRQDLESALNDFYQTSVSLAVTLHLDSSVTLVPSIDELPPLRLVKQDLPIEELLDIAVTFRPDLQSVRELVEAVSADRRATWWEGLGPTLSVSYQYGGITGHAHTTDGTQGFPNNLIVNPLSPSGAFSSNPVTNALVKEGLFRRGRRRGNQTFGFSDQQRVSAGIGWRLSLAAFGDQKTAKAREKQAFIEAQQRLDQVRAQVISSSQLSKTNDKLIALAMQQVASAEEALRLSEANLRAGTMTTLDVLQAQDAATQARLRYAQAVVHYNQSQINLLASLGLLDKESLWETAARKTPS